MLEDEVYYVDGARLQELQGAVRDILFLYQDPVESNGGFGHNLQTGSFDAMRFARAVLAPEPGFTLGVDVKLLHQGAAVAILCELSDFVDDHEVLPGAFGRTQRIRFELEAGLLDNRPLARHAARLSFEGRFDEFREGLRAVCDAYVLGHSRALLIEG